MEIKQIRYRYYIDSSIELNEIIKSIINQTNFMKGKIIYFSLEEDDTLEKELSSEEIEKEVWELYQEYEDLEINFEGIQIITDENSIEINSEIKLDLEEFDAKETEIK
jgi:hypothetical protein